MLGGADERHRDLVPARTATLDDVSSVGSAVGGAPVLPIIVGLVALAVRRPPLAHRGLRRVRPRRRVATYRVTTLVIHRDRPAVPRLESLPVDASYPSGHTAASIAVYSGLVLLLTSRFTDTRAGRAWTFAVLMTVFVALSRMYRGMHHPIDVAGGVVVGIGAIARAVLRLPRRGGAAGRGAPRARGERVA